jgi:hypothetical protein
MYSNQSGAGGFDQQQQQQQQSPQSGFMPAPPVAPASWPTFSLSRVNLLSTVKINVILSLMAIAFLAVALAFTIWTNVMLLQLEKELGSDDTGTGNSSGNVNVTTSVDASLGTRRRSFSSSSSSSLSSLFSPATAFLWCQGDALCEYAYSREATTYQCFQPSSSSSPSTTAFSSVDIVLVLGDAALYRTSVRDGASWLAQVVVREQSAGHSLLTYNVASDNENDNDVSKQLQAWLRGNKQAVDGKNVMLVVMRDSTDAVEMQAELGKLKTFTTTATTRVNFSLLLVLPLDRYWGMATALVCGVIDAAQQLVAHKQARAAVRAVYYQTTMEWADNGKVASVIDMDAALGRYTGGMMVLPTCDNQEAKIMTNAGHGELAKLVWHCMAQQNYIIPRSL